MMMLNDKCAMIASSKAVCVSMHAAERAAHEYSWKSAPAACEALGGVQRIEARGVQARVTHGGLFFLLILLRFHLLRGPPPLWLLLFLPALGIHWIIVLLSSEGLADLCGRAHSPGTLVTDRS